MFILAPNYKNPQKMKKHTLMLVLGLIAILFTNCKKDIPGCTDSTANNYKSSATDNDGSCKYDGNFMFYATEDIGIVYVSLNGESKSFDSYYPSGDPACGASGAANFKLEEGTYNFGAANTDGDKWSGSITVVKNSCKKLKLTN